MSDYGPKINSADLDRYITGNYGENQFKGGNEEMGEKVTDYLGKEIKAGQTIVYPGRKGSALWISKGKVRFVYTATEKLPHGSISIRTEGDKDRLLIHPYRVAVVEEPEVARQRAIASAQFLNG